MPGVRQRTLIKTWTQFWSIQFRAMERRSTKLKRHEKELSSPRSRPLCQGFGAFISHTHTQKKKQKNLSMTGNRVYKRIKTDHRSNVAAFALIRYSRPATDRRTRTRQATRCVHGKQHIPTCRSSVCIAWHCQVLTLGTEKSSQVSGAYLVL